MALGAAPTTEKKKRPNYSQGEDSIIITEVFATKAYCIPNRQAGLFEEVAKRLNDNPKVRGKVTRRSVRDGFYRLVKKWRADEKTKKENQESSEEVREEYKLIADMVSALDDIEEERTAVREADKLKRSDRNRWMPLFRYSIKSSV
eukprot:IDg2264t1